VKEEEVTEETVTPEQPPPIAPALSTIAKEEDQASTTATSTEYIREWDRMLEEYQPQTHLKTFEFIREWSELLKDLAAAPLPTIPLPPPVVEQENVTETAPLTIYIGFAHLDDGNEIDALHARLEEFVDECDQVEFCLRLHPYRHRIGRALRGSGALILALQVEYHCEAIVLGGKLRDKENWKKVSSFINELS
jgi:hypothetical protein